MEIVITARQIMKVLYVIAWIIFIGICVEGASFIFYSVLMLTLNPKDASHLWQQVDLTDLHRHDPGYFFVLTFIMIIVAVMRAIIFYLIVKILHDKKLDLNQPFNRDVQRFVFNVSYLSFGIGLFSWWGTKYTEWFESQGVKMPDIQHLRLGGADVWLFMGVILLVIGQIFRRGIEIQTENELTV